jgi:hypothetical protein
MALALRENTRYSKGQPSLCEKILGTQFTFLQKILGTELWWEVIDINSMGSE